MLQRRDTTANLAAYVPPSGEIVLDTTTGLLYMGDGSTAVASLVAIGDILKNRGLINARSAKSSAYTIVAGDRGKMISCTSTFTLGLTAAATLGDGFACVVFNAGSGTITLDAAGSETILTAAGSGTTVDIEEGEGGILVCTGAGWFFMLVTEGGGGGGGGPVPPVTWTSITPPENNQWMGVAFGNGIFVACAQNGTNRLMLSSNGRTWQAVAAPAARTWQKIIFADGQFVMCGDSGIVAVSRDGKNWEEFSTGAGTLLQLTWAGGFLLASEGNSTCYISRDRGRTWATVSYTFAAVNNVAWANGVFVAVGPSGAFSVRCNTSPDGLNWTFQSGLPGYGFQDVAFGLGRYVATSKSGGGGTDRIYYSTDGGVTWSATGANPLAGGYKRIVFNQGIFVLIDDDSGANTAGAYSPDGNAWTAFTMPSGGWQDLAYGNGVWVAVSNANAKVAVSGTALDNTAERWQIPEAATPQVAISAAYTLRVTDDGKQLYHPSADTTGRTWTIPANSSVPLPIGFGCEIVNDTSAGTLTIAITTDTLVLAGAGTTGSRTLAADGVARLRKVTATRWQIDGVNLT